MKNIRWSIVCVRPCAQARIQHEMMLVSKSDFLLLLASGNNELSTQLNAEFFSLLFSFFWPTKLVTRLDLKAAVPFLHLKAEHSSQYKIWKETQFTWTQKLYMEKSLAELLTISLHFHSIIALKLLEKVFSGKQEQSTYRLLVCVH